MIFIVICHNGRILDNHADLYTIFNLRSNNLDEAIDFALVQLRASDHNAFLGLKQIPFKSIHVIAGVIDRVHMIIRILWERIRTGSDTISNLLIGTQSFLIHVVKDANMRINIIIDDSISFSRIISVQSPDILLNHSRSGNWHREYQCIKSRKVKAFPDFLTRSNKNNRLVIRNLWQLSLNFSISLIGVVPIQ